MFFPVFPAALDIFECVVFIMFYEANAKVQSKASAIKAIKASRLNTQTKCVISNNLFDRNIGPLLEFFNSEFMPHIFELD